MSFFTVPIRQNGDSPALASFWNLLRTAGLAVAGWEKFTFTHTQLQAASTTNDIELFSLLAKQEITGVVIKHTVAFTGTAYSAYTLSVGLASDFNRYALPFDVFQAVGDTVKDKSDVSEVENFGSATSVRLKAISTGGDLDASTAGTVEVYIKRSTLP